jgi:phenylpropionate dioxygenase-like ring-hydroxylating dioxygenase large terminal subunit
LSGQPTLANYWHPVCATADVIEQPRRFTLLGEHIVAFRDSAGPVAMRDICVHRGAALSLGWIRGGRLTCPYHGWQYDRSGACVRIPSRPASAPIPRAARAQTYRTTERYGLVWLALEEPVAGVPAFPGDVFGKDGWREFLSYRQVWQTSAARSVENFMDFSHFPYVHPNLLGTEDRAEVPPHAVDETSFGLAYAFEQEEPSDLYGKGGTARIRYEYTLYMPFTIHLNKIEEDGVSATMISMATTPVTPTTSELYVWIVRNHSLGKADHEFGDFTNVIMEQDRVVVESQRPEQLPIDLREELHIKIPDAASILYRRLLSDLAKVEAFGDYGA